MKRKITLFASMGLALVMAGLFSTSLVEARWARSADVNGFEVVRLCTDSARIGFFTTRSDGAGIWDIIVKEDKPDGETLAVKSAALEERPPIPTDREELVHLYNYVTVWWDRPVVSGTQVKITAKHEKGFTADPGVAGIVTQCDDRDDFDRQEPRLGENWRGRTSRQHYKINNEKVKVLAGGAMYWQPTVFGFEQEAQVRLVKIDPQGHHSLLLKVQPDKRGHPDWKRGAMAVFYNAERHQVGIETYQPETGWQTVGESFNIEVQDGDQLTGRIIDNGTMFVFVNDNLIGAAVVDPFFVGKDGSIGLWFDSPNRSAVFDDFKGVGND
jgi:hypothetical protein